MQISVKTTNVAVSLGVFALGFFFLYHTNQIQHGSSGVGPDTSPRVLSWILIGLGLLGALSAWLSPSAKDGATVSFQPDALIRIGAVLAIGFGYYLAFQCFGYLIATALCLGIVLHFFGVPGVGRRALLTVLGAVAYYIVFIRVMNVYDPPGSLIDISTSLRF